MISQMQVVGGFDVGQMKSIPLCDLYIHWEDLLEVQKAKTGQG